MLNAFDARPGDDPGIAAEGFRQGTRRALENYAGKGGDCQQDAKRCNQHDQGRPRPFPHCTRINLGKRARPTTPARKQETPQLRYSFESGALAIRKPQYAPKAAAAALVTLTAASKRRPATMALIGLVQCPGQSRSHADSDHGAEGEVQIFGIRKHDTRVDSCGCRQHSADAIQEWID